MKHIFTINLTTLILLFLFGVFHPIYGIMGLLPFGVFQVILTLIIVFTSFNDDIRRLGFWHLSGTLVVVLLFLLGSNTKELFLIAGMVISMGLLVFSLVLTYKQQMAIISKNATS
jgi:hypothetical protein